MLTLPFTLRVFFSRSRIIVWWESPMHAIAIPMSAYRELLVSGRFTERSLYLFGVLAPAPLV